MDSIEHRLRTVEETTAELHSVLMGPPPARNNGVNGTLKKLIAEFDRTVDWAHDIWNNKRRTECIQLTAVKDIRDEIDSIRKEMDSMATAKINLRGVYMMGFLQFLGLIGVALIGLVK
jgi:hypothetical protein